MRLSAKLSLRSAMLVFLMAAAGRAVSGQTPPVVIQVPVTKLERLAAKRGTLIAMETYFIPNIIGDNACRIRMRAIIMYEAGREAEKVRGLRIEIAGLGAKNETEIVSYIDLDELPGLSNAIAAMLDMTLKGNALANPVAKELSYSTAGGLMITMSQREHERPLFVTHPFLTSNACVITRTGSVTEFKDSIDRALLAFR